MASHTSYNGPTRQLLDALGIPLDEPGIETGRYTQNSTKRSITIPTSDRIVKLTEYKNGILKLDTLDSLDGFEQCTLVRPDGRITSGIRKTDTVIGAKYHFVPFPRDNNEHEVTQLRARSNQAFSALEILLPRTFSHSSRFSHT